MAAITLTAGDFPGFAQGYWPTYDAGSISAEPVAGKTLDNLITGSAGNLLGFVADQRALPIPRLTVDGVRWTASEISYAAGPPETTNYIIQPASPFITGNAYAVEIEFPTYEGPTEVGVGSFAAGTASVTPSLPAGLMAGDRLYLNVSTANQAVATPVGWELVTDPLSTGSPNTAGGLRQTLFWRDYEAGDSAPIVSDSGSYQAAQIIAFRGVGIVDAIATSVFTATGSGDASWPDIETSQDNCLLVGFFAGDRDIATTDTQTANLVTPGFDGAQNTKAYDNFTNAGQGGGVSCVYGTRAARGPSTGNKYRIGANNWVNTVIMLALAPPSGGAGPAPIEADSTNTLAPATTGSSAALAIAATVGATLAAVTMGATGSLPVAGTSTSTLAPATCAGEGAFVISGASSSTLSPATMAASGTLPIGAGGNLTLSPAVAASTASLLINGVSAITLAPAFSAATAALRIDGQATTVLQPATMTASSSSVSGGSSVFTLEPVTAAGSGALAIHGLSTKTLLPAFTMSQGALSIAAAGFVTLDPATAEASSLRSAQGALSSTLAPVQSASQASLRLAGRITATLQPVTSFSAASVRIGGAAGVNLAPAGMSALSQLQIEALALPTLDPATVVASDRFLGELPPLFIPSPPRFARTVAPDFAQVDNRAVFVRTKVGYSSSSGRPGKPRF